ncbi:MAG: hypothetical protein WC371_03250 [Parachlamydiales bacterium]
MNKKIVSAFFSGLEEAVYSKNHREPLDNKIQLLALKQLPDLMFAGSGVFFSVMKMSSALIRAALGKRHRLLEEKNCPSAVRSLPGEEFLPIGLKPNPYALWLNAFLQFVLFVPSLRVLFDYTPKSFLPFNRFIDCYFADRKEGKTACSFDTLLLLEALSECFQKSFAFFKEFFDLSGLLEQIKTAAGMARSGLKNGLCKKELAEISSDDLENFFLPGPFPAALLTKQKYPFERKKHLPKQLFLPNGVLYELSAFVEYRADFLTEGSYLAYLKPGGLWYQCDDLRIVQMRSEYLQTAINRALILYYKKVELGQAKARV